MAILNESSESLSGNRKGLKVFAIIIVVSLLIFFGWSIYSSFFSSPFLKDTSEKFDYDELVVESNFEDPLTLNYLSSPLSIMDLEISSDSGYVFVVDSNAKRVMVYDYDFQSVRNLGEMYGRDGSLVVSGGRSLERDYGEVEDYPEDVFSIPVSAAIDFENNLVVFDRLAEEFRYFDSELNSIKAVKMLEVITSEINVPDVPTVDGSEINFEIMDNGNYLVHSRAENKILLLSSEGLSLISKIEPQGIISNVRVYGDSFYLIDSTNQAVIEYDSNGNLIGELVSGFSDAFDLCVSEGQMIVADKEGSLGIVDINTKTLSDTILLRNDFGKLMSPSYISCDFASNVAFVYDDESSKLLKINLDDYSVSDSISSVTEVEMLGGNPARIAINPITNDIIFADPQASAIVALDSELNLKQVIALGYGDSGDKCKMPAGMDFDSEGNLYVIDRYNRKIKVYDSNYKLVRTIENIKNNGAGLTLSENGIIAYSDETTGITSVLDASGNVIMEIESPREPKALNFYNNMLYSVEYSGDSRDIVVTEYDSDYKIMKEHTIDTHNNFDLGDGLGVYGNVAIIPDNFANELYFYDLSSDKIIKTVSVSHNDEALTGIDISVSPEEDYAMVTNAADGKIFKIDLEGMKIIQEERVTLYYRDF